ncbi:uncharacterized protein LOC119830284 [Zerene cesonia]|uniref:uncharacterized protein LOC119830284 n=1 Tax=Zerene cesonia TaxID=33412 RepID=UPI0018E4E2A8|nr:uncharacterized protein LOC119830284 [Zerene cesonia]
MERLREFEDLDEEVKELLENYKFKRATFYEPCTRNNIKDCLIGLSEELSVFNINYIFNPHIDIENDTLNTDALVKLVNSIWTLLHKYKSVKEKSDHLMEQNHILENSNRHLNDSIGKLRDKVNLEKNESRACVASAQRVSDQSNEFYQKLIETRAKLNQVVKQKEANEKCLQNKVARLKLDNEKLMDRLRGKTSNFTPCADVCDATLTQLKDRERKQRTVIAQLQANNQELLREVIAMKEELLLAGITDLRLKK